MAYVDAFVAAVPTANREAYLGHAEAAGRVFRENGALGYVECWGDDIPDGEITSFPLAVKCAADETVCLGWAMWASREIRDAAMPKIMRDERMQPGKKPMPFDGMRLIHGGFEVVVER